MIKIIIIITIVINFSICAFAQQRYIKSELLDFIRKEQKTKELFIYQQKKQLNNHFSINNNENTYYKKIRDTVYSDLKLNIGFGVIYSDDGVPIYSSIIPVNSMFKLKFIEEHIYIIVGIDIFPSYKISTSVFFINIVPAIGYDLFENKVSLYFGAGTSFRPIIFSNYYTLLGRFEYSINKCFSSGIEIKHPFFVGKEKFFQGKETNILNLFCSYKLNF
jgi:hypothetical protein